MTQSSAQPSSSGPDVPTRSPRATEIVAAARDILTTRGPDELTMRNIADMLGIRAPSIYKHFSDKAAVESALIADGLREMGNALHHAVAKPGRRTAVTSLLTAYRAQATTNPELYRLATHGPLDRAILPPGLEDWAGEPFFLATGEPHRSQALWAFAHGMVILEIDNRFSNTDDLDRTWRAGATAFS